MNYYRNSMGHDEAGCAYRRLEEVRPDLSQTSGVRSTARNAAVGGSAVSKHVRVRGRARRPPARDYIAAGMPWNLETPQGRAKATDLEHVCKLLGLWATVHGDGNGQHLHTQPTAPDAWDYTADGWE